MAAHEGWINMFSDFKGHEIAVHGYNHFTSKYYIDNRENIEKALRILSKNGINCSGYASPYGLWNKSLNDVCENLGFKYSSEFSYIYDALPLNPVINNRISPVLQIPIHPICLGSLVNAKLNENNIIEYFRNQFQWKITHCNPLIFYDHVLHNRSDLLEEIFRGVNSLDVSVLTFSEYVNWWKKRENIEYTLVKKPDNFLRIECSEPKSECFLCIWISNDTYILTNNSSIINQTTYRTNTINYNVEEDIGNLKKIRKFNFNLYKLSILNKLIWRKTG